MKKQVIILFITLIIVCVSAFAFDIRLKTVVYSIKSIKISEEIKLALVTDLHSCYYGKEQSKLLDEIEKYQPHAVLLGGDIFDDVLDDENTYVIIEKLAQKYKTYYVSGNHEWWSKRMYDMFEYLTSLGVNVLRGDSAKLKVKNDTIIIHGIDDSDVDIYDNEYINWEEQLIKVGGSAQQDYFNLLLAHRPEYVKKYFEYDFDAVLSGHAHGGQFRIPFIMNGFYAPNQGLLPKLAGGIYDFEGKKLIVSRGLARESTRLPRVFNRPELVFVNLIAQE